MSSGSWDLRASNSGRALQAAFSKALTATPFIAAIIAVVICAGSPGSEQVQPSAGTILPPVIIATVILLVTWVILALLLHISGRLTAELVNPASYYSLQTRLIDLEALHQDLCHKSDREAQPETPCGRANTRCAVGRYLASTRDELQQEGPRWMLGSGYNSTWEKLHRAEEALIPLNSNEAVLAGAKMDRLRTNGSQMKSAQELCRELDKIIVALGADGKADSAILPVTAGGTQLDRDDALGAPQRGDAASNVSRAKVREVKLMASQVRQSINEFRDRQWAQLVRRRGELTAATTFTAFTVYVLLWTAILWGATRDAILTGVTYFLIGGIVGLFNHIQIESDGSAGDSIDDYGASHARLFVTVLLSGLAALGGVVIVAILTLTQTVTLIQAGKVALPNSDPTKLVDLLSLHTYPLNLIVALTFGLTPRLLIARLKEQADEAKGAIKTSKAVDGDAVATSTIA